MGAAAAGSDPAAFEQAVCDAFDALGFVTKHMGGQKAPDGYADAALGQLGYRVMIECKTGQYAVTHPDAFEAAKYKEPYNAAFCALVGSAFGEEIELAKELQNHGVAAFAVEDLQTLLKIGSNAFEMKALFVPGFAADALGDLVWERHHGRPKRLRFIEETILRAGWAICKWLKRRRTGRRMRQCWMSRRRFGLSIRLWLRRGVGRVVIVGMLRRYSVRERRQPSSWRRADRPRLRRILTSLGRVAAGCEHGISLSRPETGDPASKPASWW